MKRIVVTGMGVHTSLGASLDEFYKNIIEGKSGVQFWKEKAFAQTGCKAGGEIWPFDFEKKLAGYEKLLSQKDFIRLRKVLTQAPWATRSSTFTALDAWLGAGRYGSESDPAGTVITGCGHNVNMNYIYKCGVQYGAEPSFMDPLESLLGLDTDTFATVSEVLGVRGGVYSVGGACASGNLAIRSAIDEIRYHGVHTVVLVGAPCDFSPVDLQSMVLMGALSKTREDQDPKKASRPFDLSRDGFVPAQGAGVLILEDLEFAQKRGAQIQAEILAAEGTSDGNHLPVPNEDGQVAVLKKVFAAANVLPTEVDFVSAHATSTPVGDLCELRTLERFFGAHAKNLKINSLKSIIGHTLWSSAIIEIIAGILQMQRGKLHPSINIETLDPAVKLNVCANTAVDYSAKLMLKNAFGFGGINSACLVRKWT